MIVSPVTFTTRCHAVGEVFGSGKIAAAHSAGLFSRSQKEDRSAFLILEAAVGIARE
jgi:hypothetical protein